MTPKAALARQIERYRAMTGQQRLRIALDLFGIGTWIATAEDVILHKLYWNKLTPSNRQLQDAAGVYAVQAGALDQAYLAQWATTLQVQQELNDLASGRITPKST